jgi:hypothetical protein
MSAHTGTLPELLVGGGDNGLITATVAFVSGAQSESVRLSAFIAVATRLIAAVDGRVGAEMATRLPLTMAARTAVLSPAATVQRLGTRWPSPSESIRFVLPS